MPQILKKIAAIDIGSNAMRAVLATFSNSGHLKIFKNYRYPIRLGEDVFSKGKLTKSRIKITEEAFSELFIKLSKHKITEVYAVGTSALRDAENSRQLIDLIKNQTGIQIKVINGTKEAELIKYAVETVISLNGKIALLIDIGGGSTEVTLTKNGKILVSKSYQYGTVRLLKSLRSNQFEQDIETFSRKVKTYLNKYLKGHEINMCIGTGGNLRRMGKLRHQIFKKPTNRVTMVEINSMYSEVVNLSVIERVERFGMRADRADVIAPAMAMIEQILLDNNIYEILLPKVGLKEGVLLENIKDPVRELHLQVKNQ